MLAGVAAGAAGTAVLNATTYLDIAVRGRAPSDLPSRMAKHLAQKIGISLDEHRQTGLGMLLGYADGLSVGAILSGARAVFPRLPMLWTGMALGIATLAISEGTATLMHEADPATWTQWLSSLLPRFMYGWTACLIYDRFTENER